MREAIVIRILFLIAKIVARDASWASELTSLANHINYSRYTEEKRDA